MTAKVLVSAFDYDPLCIVVRKEFLLSWEEKAFALNICSKNLVSFSASAFKAVQVIKEADTKTLVSNVYEHRLKPQYDLFSPSKPFRKGNPPLPDFHLCILK